MFDHPWAQLKKKRTVAHHSNLSNTHAHIHTHTRDHMCMSFLTSPLLWHLFFWTASCNFQLEVGLLIFFRLQGFVGRYHQQHRKTTENLYSFEEPEGGLILVGHEVGSCDMLLGTNQRLPSHTVAGASFLGNCRWSIDQLDLPFPDGFWTTRFGKGFERKLFRFHMFSLQSDVWCSNCHCLNPMVPHWS